MIAPPAPSDPYGNITAAVVPVSTDDATGVVSEAPAALNSVTIHVEK